MNDRDLALICADIAYERKADDIVILDVGKILVIASYFVIASGKTRKHLQGIADAMRREIREQHGIPRLGIEGYQEGRWILLDYGDVIVQLFAEDTRREYDLESIWADAKRLAWTPRRPRANEAGDANDEADLATETGMAEESTQTLGPFGLPGGL